MIKGFNRFKNNGLFVKMFIVMVVSIVLVSVLITLNTFRVSEKLFVDTFSITNNKIINQINTNFETFTDVISMSFHEVQQSDKIKAFLTEKDFDAKTDAKAYYNINEQMTSITSNIDIPGINMFLVGENGRSFSTNYVNWPISKELLQESAITENTYRDPKKIMFQYDPLNLDTKTSHIIASKPLYDRETESIYGLLYISIQENELNRFYDRYTSAGNDVVIIDQSGRVASSNQKDLIGHKEMDLLQYAKEKEEDKSNYNSLEVFGKKKIVISQHIPIMDFYLVNLIDKDLVMNNLIDTKSIVIISLLIVSVAVVAVFFITGRLTKSLKLLVSQISNMAKNDFDQYVTVDGNDETKQLATTFNYMLDELHDYVNQLIETQKKQREAELSALQQQINPHFLYNTLTSINIMVQQGNKEKSADTIYALVSLLENTVGNPNEIITVEQELENMRHYVFINQGRYGDRIKVNYFIAPECLNHGLPKLIIQPFMENAFFHAFNKKESGHIHLLIAEREDDLVCEIVDNGDGMEMNERRIIQHNKKNRHLFSGIGIHNVNERIKLLYGENYGVELSSHLGEGTTVKIRLPIIKQNDFTKNQ